MKDNEIHKGLPEEEMRNFISISISELLSPSEKPKIATYDESDPWRWHIENHKNEIIFSQNEINRLEKLRSVITIMKMKGWEENDCSDHVERTMNNGHYRNFIGTEKEFKKFMKDNNFKN
jgi:hypothetical protein